MSELYFEKPIHGATMRWNGENTKQVVEFCRTWDLMLCPIHSIVDGKLRIEPADTMRGSCVYIPLGHEVERMIGKNGRFIAVH